MKKITTKVLTILAACAAMVFASCAQPSTSGSGAGAGTDSKVVWEGSTTFTNWAKGSAENDINIEKEKITENTTGLRITWSASASSGVVLKMQDMNWGSNGDMSFKKPDDEGFGTECYLWATSTTTDFTFNSISLSTVKQYGVQVYGDKITITKVELIEN